MLWVVQDILVNKKRIWLADRINVLKSIQNHKSCYNDFTSFKSSMTVINSFSYCYFILISTLQKTISKVSRKGGWSNLIIIIY